MSYKRSKEDGQALANELVDYIRKNPDYKYDSGNPDDPMNKIILNHTPDNYNPEDDKDE
jgi:hypothetical protein